ncbi:MAG: hypothetical protein CME71_11680 [Halobacteriovorax sp.]|nr:hypothetical protein [Halobacteriovorax sp.]|tara:strand:+ start:6935 stop:7171 length:237 start_codon:yes stop_codon:yes gene_type:complete
MSKESLSREQICERAGNGILICQVWMDKLVADEMYADFYTEAKVIIGSVCGILQEIQTGSELSNYVTPKKKENVISDH